MSNPDLRLSIGYLREEVRILRFEITMLRKEYHENTDVLKEIKVLLEKSKNIK